MEFIINEESLSRIDNFITSTEFIHLMNDRGLNFAEMGLILQTIQDKIASLESEEE